MEIPGGGRAPGLTAETFHTGDHLANARRQAEAGIDDMLVIDALRRKPHPTHAHLDKTLEWIETLRPQKAVLTNMHIDLDYDTVTLETPDHITPAFDGLVIRQAL